MGDVPDSLKEYIVQQIGDEAPAKRVIVDATQRRQKYLDLRPDDVFVATAWWTALNAFRLHDLQKSLFGNAPKVVYLIQDFEPDFYGWSTRYALAESTYMRGDDTIALINSEELLQYFETRYSHPAKMLISYTPNAKVDATLTRVPRERIILFYSRPAALRNCFESGIDGLALWARRNPVLANKWKVYCIGEEFDSSFVRSVPNCTVTGKMPLDEYARLLSQASVGVSLMISPHPSYPPLEMAYSGIRTITNKYMNKDLASRSGFITSIDLPTPELIAQALEDEVNRAEKEMIGQITPIRNKIEDIPVEVPAFDPAAVIRLLG
ncbi:glycosyltransferase family 4 protein [Ochrobactrum ciceri]|uniref:Glycosyltransferase family 4 protein n=1 Tax=Brucella ciceri TaxID=391287 RepID=A0ABX1DXQ8_9HYPH|nr:glycosyltransferase family 4 protein [Brucella ciceri]